MVALVDKAIRFARAKKGISLLDRLWLCPWRLLEGPQHQGNVAAPWQKSILSQLVTRQDKGVIILAPRGGGKSESTAAAAYLEACMGGYVLVVSPSDRQSIGFFEHVKRYHSWWNLCPIDSEPTKHELRLRNGGRVWAVPNSEGKLRGIHNVTLLVYDEASRIDDSMYSACLPMRAANGRMVLLSTPNGARGFFHREWMGEGRKGWRRHLVTWRDCPWISPTEVEEYRRSTNDLMAEQEFSCSFVSLTSSPFDINAMMNLERAEYPVG